MSVNKAILIGNLGKDVDVRHFPSGDPVANVAIATSKRWRDKEGNQQERTEWHNLVFRGGLAKVAGDYLGKGSKIYVEGEIRTRKYTDKASGQDRYVTEIHVDEMQMLDGKRESSGSSTPRREQPQRSTASRQPQPASADAGFEDDDIL